MAGSGNSGRPQMEPGTEMKTFTLFCLLVLLNLAALAGIGNTYYGNFVGDGSSLTNLPGASNTNYVGTFTGPQFQIAIPGGGSYTNLVDVSGNLDWFTPSLASPALSIAQNGTVTAAGQLNAPFFNATGSGFAGNGGGVTNLQPAAINGQLSYSQLPATVMSNNFDILSSPANGGFAGGTFWGNGSRLTNLNLSGPTSFTGLVCTNKQGCTTGTNFCTYTVPASQTNVYEVGGYINVTAVSLDVVQSKVYFTDENNAAQVVNLIATGVSTTGFNPLSNQQIVAIGGTSIVLSNALTTGTGSIAYDTGGNIKLVKSYP